MNSNIRCSICENEKFAPLFKKGNLALVKCLGCGLVRVNNLTATFDIRLYDYYKERINISKEELYNPINTKRYLELLNRLEFCRNNNTLFEIGSGEGQLLSVAKSRHWQVEGIELAPYAVEICKKFNLNVQCADFLKTDIKSGYYDVVVMSEVMEHLTHPQEYLLKANNILRENGILVITTPNFNCITRRLLQKRWSLINKEHLFYFTPRSLKLLLRKCNFEIIGLRVSLITLPELYRLFKRQVDDVYNRNQVIRRTIETNRLLRFLKSASNKFLNLTGTGESIECICRKSAN